MSPITGDSLAGGGSRQEGWRCPRGQWARLGRRGLGSGDSWGPRIGPSTTVLLAGSSRPGRALPPVRGHRGGVSTKEVSQKPRAVNATAHWKRLRIFTGPLGHRPLRHESDWIQLPYKWDTRPRQRQHYG
jgi:hypothetical protein